MEMLAMDIRKNLANKIWLAFLLPMGIFVNGGYEKQLQAREPEKMSLNNKVLIDDFSSAGEISALGTKWAFITDQVMGSISTGSMQFVQHNNLFCVHIKGDVPLKNNGGFIEAHANLHPQGKPFDARAFEGIYLRAKGNGERYAIHLQTKDTRLSWQFYEAIFKTDETWQEFKIRFRRFVPFFLKKPLDSNNIRSVAIVAINKTVKGRGPTLAKDARQSYLSRPPNSRRAVGGPASMIRYKAPSNGNPMQMEFGPKSCAPNAGPIWGMSFSEKA